MLSLFLGLIAALSWGIHDVCVRFAVARAGVSLALLVVLAAGLVFVAPLALIWGNWSNVGATALMAAGAAGMSYAVGGYGLYRAFAIGPVGLVAPVIGAFPILSILWAAAQGQWPSPGQGLAVLVIVTGVVLTAVMAEHHGEVPTERRTGAALMWSLAGAFGFALTFALGQWASLGGAELPSVLITRIAAFLALLAATRVAGQHLTYSRAPWGLLAIMGLCDALALGLVIAAGGLPHPEFAAVAASVFGVITILLAWVALGEKLDMRQWGAVAMVFAGIGYLGL